MDKIFTKPEFALITRLHSDFPKKMIDAIADELEQRWNAEKLAFENSKAEQYERRMIIKRSDGILSSEMTLIIRYVNIGKDWGEQGFRIYYCGKCSDGKINITHDMDSRDVGVCQRGEFPFVDFIKICEYYEPTEYIYNAIELAFESLKYNYKIEYEASKNCIIKRS